MLYVIRFTPTCTATIKQLKNVWCILQHTIKENVNALHYYRITIQ